METAVRKRNDLGRLKSLGLSAPWQVALLLPNGWDDLTRPLERYDRPIWEGDIYLVIGQLVANPEVRFGNGAPRLVGSLSDPDGRRIGFSAFGDTRELEGKLKESREKVALLGQLDTFNNRLWLKNPEIVLPGWVGKLRPRYPGKTGLINPETVRDRILQHLKTSVPLAADFLGEQLREFGSPEELAQIAGLPGWHLEGILWRAHLPRSIEEGERAQQSLEHLAALGMIKAAKGNQGTKKKTTPLAVGDWHRRTKTIPFALTGEQQRAITDALADLSGTEPMRRILSGDVGTGKTAVYGTICACVVDGRGTAAVLLPNEALAAQIAREFSAWWPDLPLQLITGSSGKERITAPLVIGTTALLHRGFKAPDLVVVDEQQKFSREQRERMVRTNTRLLEVTATCIPRSQALIRYGVLKVSKLTQAHTKKTIHTRIWMPEEGNAMYTEVLRTLRDGHQVLLVYPLREKGDEKEGEREPEGQGRTQQPELRSAEEIYEKWSRLLPGKARWVHGQMSEQDKEKALKDMTEGTASVLVATTVVEVGINIPRLRRVIIVHPERHGLTTLHQIRGRVARLGGEGWCDLYMPYRLKELTMERLRVLERTQDGFEIAEWDMRLRGVGDLSQSSSKQSGADDTFLFGRPVRTDILDAVIQRLSDTGD